MSLLILLSVVPILCYCCCCQCCKGRSKISPLEQHPTNEEPPSNGSTSSLSERSGKASRTLRNSDTHVDALAQAEEGSISEPHISVWGQHPTTEEIPPNGSASSLSERSSRASRTFSNSDTHVDALARAEEGNINEPHISVWGQHPTTEETPSNGSASSLSEISSRASRTLRNSVDVLARAEEGNITCISVWGHSDDTTVKNNLFHGHEPTTKEIFQSESRFPTKLHEFINLRVIPGFKRQRETGRVQFAVLLLVSESNLEDINRFEFEPRDCNGQPLVNNAQPYWPNRHHLGNYLVARPRHPNKHDIAQGRHTTHSEILLLQQLPNLLYSFGSQEPAHIILYSWFMPCPDCTERIINELQFKNRSVMVIYSQDWFRISQSENEASRAKLTGAGITVQQITYHQALPSVGDSDTDDYDYDSYDHYDHNDPYDLYDPYNLYDSYEHYDRDYDDDYNDGYNTSSGFW